MPIPIKMEVRGEEIREGDEILGPHRFGTVVDREAKRVWVILTVETEPDVTDSFDVRKDALVDIRRQVTTAEELAEVRYQTAGRPSRGALSQTVDPGGRGELTLLASQLRQSPLGGHGAASQCRDQVPAVGTVWAKLEAHRATTSLLRSLREDQS